jgi:hypothetical protein
MKNQFVKIFSLALVAALSGCGDETAEIEADVATEEPESCFNDANCDGVTEYFDESVGYCQKAPGFGAGGRSYPCMWSPGWFEGISWVPGCGVSGDYLTDCEMRIDPDSNNVEPRDCFPVIQEKTQTCE